MNKRNLELIAQQLRGTIPARRTRDAMDQWRKDVIAVGDVCLTLDPTFDSQRFYKLAGLEITMDVRV